MLLILLLARSVRSSLRLDWRAFTLAFLFFVDLLRPIGAAAAPSLLEWLNVHVDRSYALGGR